MPVATGAKRKRGEGQWALGYREPLNKNEENKRNDDGLNVRQRIIDADEIIDGTAEIAAITRQYIGDAAFSNLPRKFKSAISGCPAQCAIHEINDIALVGVVNGQGETGYDLWVGGGLSTNPMIGK